jgi:hypothetical protein
MVSPYLAFVFGWTGPGLLKDGLMQQPEKTRLTWRVDL